jgi:hypothetical protein
MFSIDEIEAMIASRKFSFGNTRVWFVSIAADEGAVSDCSISVEIC